MLDEARIKMAVTSIIEAIGEDPHREGLAGTPERVETPSRETLDTLKNLGYL